MAIRLVQGMSIGDLYEKMSIFAVVRGLWYDEIEQQNYLRIVGGVGAAGSGVFQR